MEFELFSSQDRKNGSKTLKKHCLQKVFASCFPKVQKPYKTNGKLIFPRGRKTHEKACKTKGILALLGQNRKKGFKNIEKALPRGGFRIVFCAG